MKKQFKLKKSFFVPILSLFLAVSVSCGVFLFNASASEQPVTYDSVRADGIKGTSSADYLYSEQCSMPYVTILNRNSESQITDNWQSGVFGVSDSSVQNNKRSAYIEAFVFDLLQRAYPGVQSNSFAEQNGRARQASMLEKICAAHNTDAATYATHGVSGMDDGEFNSFKNELISSGELTPTVEAVLDDLRGINTNVGELTRGMAAASEVDLLKTSCAAALRSLFPANQVTDPDLANAVNRVAYWLDSQISDQNLISMIYSVSTSGSKDVKPWADTFMSLVWQRISEDLYSSGAVSSTSLTPGKFGVNTFSGNSVIENYFELMKLADLTNSIKARLSGNTLNGEDFISAYNLLLGADKLTAELTLDFAENGADSGLFVSVTADNPVKLAEYKNRIREIKAELDYFQAFSERAFYNSFLLTYAPGAASYLNLSLIDAQYGSDEFSAATANIKKLAFSSGDVALTSSYAFDDNYDIFGDLTISASVSLGGKTVTVEGSVNHTRGTLSMDSGTLNNENNYSIESSGSLHMNDSDARLNVRKNLSTESSYSHSGYLTNGVMTVGGNITQRGTYASFATTNSFTTVLNGSDTQTVDFQNGDSGLNIVRFDNNKVVFAGVTRGFKLADNAVINNDLSIQLCGELKLNGYDFTVNGDFELGGSGNVYLEGQTMTVNGSLTQSGSTMKLNGGTLNTAGNYDILTDGKLHMTYENDRLNVGESFSTASSTSHSGYLNNGIMTVKGNFTQIGETYSSFNTSGYHKTVFNGSSTQRIKFDSTDNGFKDVEFVNKKIVLDSALRSLTLYHDIEIDNDWDLKMSSLDLNDHTLKINGNLAFNKGTINFDNGTIDVRDDFEIGESGGIHMTNEGDILNIGGDFSTYSSYSHSGYLTKGVMTVGGDITQRGASASFATSQDFTTVLNGSDTQTIDFQSVDSGLNIVRFDCADIVFTGSTRGFKLADNAVINNDLSIQLGGDFKLNGYDFTVNGDFELGGSGNVYLEGQTMTVNGSLTQSGSTMKLNGGTLNITGDYNISSDGVLHMTNDNDRLNVGGSFGTSSSYSHSGYLNKGIMTVKGNFTQSGASGSFSAGVSHKVVLDGLDKVQLVYFESASSGFNTLTLVKDKLKGYRFSRPVCWNNLELITAVYDFVVYSPLDTMATGSSVRLTEKIDGINLSENPVNYSVSGNTSENTYITNDGVLYIGEDEEASTITIEATSADDDSYTTSFDISIANSGESIIGDVDQNGVVTINDATAIQYYIADFGTLTENQLAAADVDGDGEISIKDVTKLQKYLANLIPSLA
ncbi:MAG: hypothetical protein IIZ36_04110 [Ruminococcus sp.]|nr:hypothetical protein [Ruminococcus sp.]